MVIHRQEIEEGIAAPPPGVLGGSEGEGEFVLDPKLEKFRGMTRQLDILPPTSGVLETPISIFGAGAIGSFVTWGLANSGFSNLTVFDDDIVSIENQSCSIYREEDIGREKVSALALIVKQFCNIDLKIEKRRFAGVDAEGRSLQAEMPPLGVSIGAVDSMKARKTIWDVFAGGAHPKAWFIDSRMSAEEGQIYTLRPCLEVDRKMYADTLYSDAEAAQEKCTSKATTYTAMALAGEIVNSVKNVLTRQPEEYARIVQWSIKHHDLVAHKVRFDAIAS